MLRASAAAWLALVALLGAADARAAADIDLHTHSYCSDGLKTPEELVDQAAAAGLKYYALSDHDSIDCLDRAAAAAREKGITFIPAIEFSAEDGLVHILGLGIDPASSALRRQTQSMQAERIRWFREVLGRLEDDGIELDEYEDVLLPKWNAERKSDQQPELSAAQARGMGLSADDVIGRIHGAITFTDLRNAMLRRGHTVEQLKKAVEGHGTKGPGFRETIALIHAAGGVAILAHPYTIFKFIKKWPIHYSGKDYPDFESFADDLLAAGLDGFELHRPLWERYPEDYERMMRIVRGAGRPLLLSPGSDYHGYDAGVPDRLGPPALGGIEGYPVEEEARLLEALKIR